MRDFFSPGRSVAVGSEGMAATSHPLSTLAAVEILKSAATPWTPRLRPSRSNASSSRP
jgi:hypothetical protein